jgi:dihydrofolate reductase
MISIIVAMDENKVIGKNNQLPWHLPADLAYFKQVTMGHPIIMGRKTHESIGRVLPGRENVILTRNRDYFAEGCTIIHSIDDLVEWEKRQNDEIFVIGGAEIFKQTLPITEKLYITKIHHHFTGDTYFPEYDESDWELIWQQKGVKDEKNPYDYDFVIYERRK